MNDDLEWQVQDEDNCETAFREWLQNTVVINEAHARIAFHAGWLANQRT